MRDSPPAHAACLRHFSPCFFPNNPHQPALYCPHPPVLPVRHRLLRDRLPSSRTSFRKRSFSTNSAALVDYDMDASSYTSEDIAAPTCLAAITPKAPHRPLPRDQRSHSHTHSPHLPHAHAHAQSPPLPSRLRPKAKPYRDGSG